MPTSRRPPGRGANRSRRTSTSAQAARTAPATTVARSRFTGRMAVLVVVLAVLVVSYASSMRAYLQQRQHIASLHAQISDSRGAIGRLKSERQRWKDPAYVRTQAKLRFGWVMPGDTAYQVIGKDGKPLEVGDRLADSRDVVQTAPTPWWAKQYASLQKADHPPTAPAPPVSSIKPQKN